MDAGGWYASLRRVLREMHVAQFLWLVDVQLVGNRPDLVGIGKECMLYGNALLAQFRIPVKGLGVKAPTVAEFPVVEIRIQEFRIEAGAGSGKCQKALVHGRDLEVDEARTARGTDLVYVLAKVDASETGYACLGQVFIYDFRLGKAVLRPRDCGILDLDGEWASLQQSWIADLHAGEGAKVGLECGPGIPKWG